MKRAVTLAALASLAVSSNVDNFADDELNFFKSIGNGLKKAGEFIVKHPKIITTAVKILALEDSLEDDNLLSLDEYLETLEYEQIFPEDIDYIDIDDELYFRNQPQNPKKPSPKLPHPNVIKNYISFNDISNDFLAAIKPAPKENKPTMTHIPVDAKPNYIKRHISFDVEETSDNSLNFLSKIKPNYEKKKPFFNEDQEDNELFISGGGRNSQDEKHHFGSRKRNILF